MEADRLAGDCPPASNDVQHTLRQASLCAEFGEPQQAQRRTFSRFQDHRIAGGKRRRDLPGADHQRKIPGHDGGDDTDRLAMDEAEDIARGRCDLAIDLVDRFGIVAECAGSAAGLRLQRHRNLGAIVAHAENGKLERVFLDEFGDAQQHLLALGGCGPRPGALLEGGAGGQHGGIDVVDAGIGDRRQSRPINRRDDVKHPAGGSVAPDAADEEFLRWHHVAAQLVDFVLHVSHSMCQAEERPIFRPPLSDQIS